MDFFLNCTMMIMGLKRLKYTVKASFFSVGRSKANQGWTPLHLASYFGHKNVVKALLEVSQISLCNFRHVRCSSVGHWLQIIE